MQPHYRYDRRTRKLDLLDPKQVAEWLRDGFFDMLLGTLIPDVVVHGSGNPLQIQDAFDFKFPCPSDNSPQWYRYDVNHPYKGRSQGDMYQEALGVQEPALVAPGHGIIR